MPISKIGKFTLNYKNKFSIAINGENDINKVDETVFAPLAAGINNMTPASNETATNDEYYDGEGFGTSDITSKRLQLTLAGHRVEGDAAQDFIASKLLSIGDDLKTLFKWEQIDGSIITGVVTITNLVTSGGAPGAKQTFSVVLVFNGKPQYKPAGSESDADDKTPTLNEATVGDTRLSE